MGDKTGLSGLFWLSNLI